MKEDFEYKEHAYSMWKVDNTEPLGKRYTPSLWKDLKMTLIAMCILGLCFGYS